MPAINAGSKLLVILTPYWCTRYRYEIPIINYISGEKGSILISGLATVVGDGGASSVASRLAPFAARRFRRSQSALCLLRAVISMRALVHDLRLSDVPSQCVLPAEFRITHIAAELSNATMDLSLHQCLRCLNPRDQRLTLSTCLLRSVRRPKRLSQVSHWYIFLRDGSCFFMCSRQFERRVKRVPHVVHSRPLADGILEGSSLDGSPLGLVHLKITS